MSIGIVVFLAGLSVVPLVLLAWGHKARKLGPGSRRAFWGAVIGHCLAGTLAITLGMIPPERWTAEATVRGFFGLWSLLLFPVAGAIGGVLVHARRR